MTPHPIADHAAGTRLESWFNRHPNLSVAFCVALVLLLLVIGALLDGAPK